jgi:predicted MFS family arabinose efflux permease
MRKNIFLMNILVVFFWMSMYSYVPNLPEYAQSLGADAVVLGIIGGVYGIAQILIRIPIGTVSDKTGKNKRMLIVGSTVLAASAGILVLAQDTDMLIFGRLVAGAAAAWWVIQSATYAHYHHDEGQVKAQGVLSASANWGKLIAALAGGLLAQFFGLRSIFVFAFAVALACVFLSTRITDGNQLQAHPHTQEHDLPSKGGTLAHLIPLFKNRDLMLFSSIGISFNILYFAAPTLFTAVAARDLGASSLDLGLLNVVFYLLAGGTSLFVGTRAYKKIGGIRVLALSFCITAVSCIPFFYHMNLATVYIMQALSGAGFGISAAAVAGFVIRAVLPHQRGAATGIFQSLFGIGIFIGPVIAGTITQWVSLDAAYWTLVAIQAATAIVCLVFIPKKYGAM